MRLFTLREELAPGALGEEDLEVISGEISRLERIVKDFLDFARPSEPKLETGKRMRCGFGNSPTNADQAREGLGAIVQVQVYIDDI